MATTTHRSNVWRPRLRLWHLFALVALAAVLVWLWPRVGLELNHKPGVGSRAAIIWSVRKSIELWNTFPPPPAATPSAGLSPSHAKAWDAMWSAKEEPD